VPELLSAERGGRPGERADARDSRSKIARNDGEFPAWSPDSRQIVFDSARGNSNPFDQDLYTMRADGSRQRSLGHRDGSQIMPTWSPDGIHVAYVDDPDYWTGQAQLVVLPTGDGVDVYGSGPKDPMRIWELTLGSSASPVQLSSGEADLFPHYTPATHLG
jgi:Tol biopolymer transport system component